MLVALNAAPAQAQEPVTIQVEAAPTTVTVGDRIRPIVTVTMPADGQLDAQAFEGQFGELDVIFVGLPDEQVLPNGRRQVRIAYEVAAFRTGTVELPALEARVRLADGSPLTAVSAPITITVESVIPAGENPTAVRDLKPVFSLPPVGGLATRRIVIGVASVALLLLLALLVWRRLRRPARVAVPLALPRSAEAIARDELDRIAGLGLIERGAFKEQHALMAACIRRYLTDRYAFPAYALTTTELRRRMSEAGVGQWQGRLVVGLLNESDNVNFAAYVPARTRAEANLEMAYQIVEAGEPQAEPAAATAAQAV